MVGDGLLAQGQVAEALGWLLILSRHPITPAQAVADEPSLRPVRVLLSIDQNTLTIGSVLPEPEAQGFTAP